MHRLEGWHPAHLAPKHYMAAMPNGALGLGTAAVIRTALPYQFIHSPCLRSEHMTGVLRL